MNTIQAYNSFNPSTTKVENTYSDHLQTLKTKLMLVAGICLSLCVLLKFNPIKFFKSKLFKQNENPTVNKVYEKANKVFDANPFNVTKFPPKKVSPSIYQLTKKSQRIFDATIDNICKNLGISNLPDNDKHNSIHQSYIHVLTLTESEDEVLEAIEYLKENILTKKTPVKLIQDFIKRIKKINDCDQINAEVIERTRGIGQMRFHATNGISFKSIQEHGLTFKHRDYNRDLFLQAIAIADKAKFGHFLFADQDVSQQTLCTSTILNSCLTNYGQETTPEWFRIFYGEIAFDKILSKEDFLSRVQALLNSKRGVLTQNEINLYLEFASRSIDTYNNPSVGKRVFIVCKKDKLNDASSLGQYRVDYDRRRNFAESLIYSINGNENEIWTQSTLNGCIASILKPENLDFFILS